MDTLLPSEIARLIYGYLEGQNCTAAAQCFLETCPLLSECLTAKKKGRRVVSRVHGLNLSDILEDYSDSHFILSEHVPSDPNDSISSTDGSKLSTQLKAVFDTLKQNGSKPTVNCSSTTTQTEKVLVSDISVTAFIQDTEIRNAAPQEPVAPGAESDHARASTSTQAEEQEPSIVQIITLDSTSLSTSVSPHKRKTPRKRRNSINSGDSDSSLKDRISPTTIIKNLLKNTQLHETLADNINQILNASAESNTAVEERENNLESSSGELNEAAIHTVVEQTQADPIFNELMNEIFSSAFEHNGSESDDHAVSHKGSSEGEVDNQETTSGLQKRLPQTPHHIPCLLSTMVETPRSPAPSQFIAVDTGRELNTPIHHDTNSRSSIASSKKDSEISESTTEKSKTEVLPLKARLRSAQKKAVPNEGEDSSGVTQEAVLESQNEEAVHGIVGTLPTEGSLEAEPCMLISADVCVEMPSEVQAALSNNSMVLKATSGNKDILELAMTNCDVVTPERPSADPSAPVTTFANAIFTVGPLAITQPTIALAPPLTLIPNNSISTGHSSSVPPTNIFLPEHGRFVAIPVPPKNDKRLISIAPKASPAAEVEHDCRYLRNKQSKQLRAKEARSKGVKLVPDRKIQHQTSKEATSSRSSDQLLNVLGNNPVPNANIIVATIGTSIFESAEQGAPEMTESSYSPEKSMPSPAKTMPPNSPETSGQSYSPVKNPANPLRSLPIISPMHSLPVISPMHGMPIISPMHGLPSISPVPAVPEPQPSCSGAPSSSQVPEVQPAEPEMAAPASVPAPAQIISPPEQQTTVRRCPPRKSMSTPRRDRSHIRTLDFSTPPQGRSMPRKSLTSPKGKPPQVSPNTANKLSRAKRIVRAELFQAVDESMNSSSEPVIADIPEELEAPSENVSDAEPTCVAPVNAESTNPEPVCPDLTSSSSSEVTCNSPQKTASNASESVDEASPSVSGIATRNPGEPKVTRSCWDKVNGVDLILGSPKKPIPPCASERLSVRHAFGKDWDAELRKLIVPDEPPFKNKRSRDSSASSERGGKKLKKAISKEIVSEDNDGSSDFEFEPTKSKTAKKRATKKGKPSKESQENLSSSDDIDDNETPRKQATKTKSKVVQKGKQRSTQKRKGKVISAETVETSSSDEESPKPQSKSKKTNKKSQKTPAKKKAATVEPEEEETSSSEDETQSTTSKNQVSSETLDAPTQSQVLDMSSSIGEEVAEPETATNAEPVSSGDDFEPPKAKKTSHKVQSSVRQRSDKSSSSKKKSKKKSKKSTEAPVPQNVEDSAKTSSAPTSEPSLPIAPIVREPINKIIIQSPRSVSKHVILRNEIHGDSTKSPRRVLELASSVGTCQSYITPTKVDEPSTSQQEETPLTKLLRGQNLDALELTLVDTPLFPLTPNCMLPTTMNNSPPSPPNCNYFPSLESSQAKETATLDTSAVSNDTEVSLHVVEALGDEMETTVIETTVDTRIIEEVAAAVATSSQQIMNDESQQPTNVSSPTKCINLLLAEAQDKFGVRKSMRLKDKKKSTMKVEKSVKIVLSPLSPEDIDSAESGTFRYGQDENRPPLVAEDVPSTSLRTDDFDPKNMDVSSASQLLDSATLEQQQDMILLHKLEETKRRMAQNLKRDFAKKETPIVHLRAGGSRQSDVFGKNTKNLLAQRFGKKNAAKRKSQAKKMTNSRSTESEESSQSQHASQNETTEKISDTANKSNEPEVTSKSNEKPAGTEKTSKSKDKSAGTSKTSKSKDKESENGTNEGGQSSEPQQRKSRDRSKEKTKQMEPPKIPSPSRKESKSKSEKQRKSRDSSEESNEKSGSTKHKKSKKKSKPSGNNAEEATKLQDDSNKKSNKEVTSCDTNETVESSQTESQPVASTSQQESSDTPSGTATNFSAPLPPPTPLMNISPRKNVEVVRSPRKGASPLKLTPRKSISVDDIAAKLRGVVFGSDDDSMPPLVFHDSPVKHSESSDCSILEQLGLHSRGSTPIKVPVTPGKSLTSPRTSVPETVSVFTQQITTHVEVHQQQMTTHVEVHQQQLTTQESRREGEQHEDERVHHTEPETDKRPVEVQQGGEENVVKSPHKSNRQDELFSRLQQVLQDEIHPMLPPDSETEQHQSARSQQEGHRHETERQQTDSLPQNREKTEADSQQTHRRLEHPAESHRPKSDATNLPTQQQDNVRSRRDSSSQLSLQKTADISTRRPSTERGRDMERHESVEISSSQVNSKVYRMYHEKMYEFKHLSTKRKLKRLKLNVEKEECGRIIAKKICLNFTPTTLLFSHEPYMEQHSRRERSRDSEDSYASRHRGHSDERHCDSRYRRGEDRYRVEESRDRYDDRHRAYDKHKHSDVQSSRRRGHGSDEEIDNRSSSSQGHHSRRDYRKEARKPDESHHQEVARSSQGHRSSRDRQEHRKEARKVDESHHQEVANRSSSSQGHHSSKDVIKDKRKTELTKERSVESNPEDDLMTYALVGSVHQTSPDLPQPSESHPLPLKKRRGPTEESLTSKPAVNNKAQRKADNPQDMLRKVGMDNLLSVLHGDADS